MELDFGYICETMGNLSGIPIRVYQGEEELFFFSMVKLPKDPMIIYKDDILKVTDNISYFSTQSQNYYGIFNIDDKKFIIGPTRYVPNTTQELRNMAFRADVPVEQTDEFIAAMKSIVGLPLERLIQMMCLMNYLIKGEKLDMHKSIIYEEQQESLQKDMVKQHSDQLTDSLPFYQKVSNSFKIESTLLDMIAKGDITTMEEWLKSPTTAQNGIVAASPLRQLKNTMISTITLASRSAISGGMAPADAIKLAENYIYQTELLNSPEKIINLQYHAIKTFTQNVNALKLGKIQSKLVTDVAIYIQHNLSKNITAQEIADALFISRPYLSKKFKEESGISITDFIRNKKIEEAKRLLKYTDKSLLSISVYLGYSSQSHFTHSFKKETGKNPKDFRMK